MEDGQRCSKEEDARVGSVGGTVREVSFEAAELSSLAPECTSSIH